PLEPCHPSCFYLQASHSTRPMALYAVIMAGGIGSRFWPRSRRAHPKQFLDVLGPASLIQSTFARLQPLIPPDRVYVVTHADYVAQTREHLPAVPPEHALAEPAARNTAPRIALAAAPPPPPDPPPTPPAPPAHPAVTPVPR